MEAVLGIAGKMKDEARRRTTCIVHSNDPVKARVYMRLAGEIIPVANRATREEPPPPPSEVPALNVALSGLTASTGTLLPPCDRAGRNEATYTVTVMCPQPQPQFPLSNRTYSLRISLTRGPCISGELYQCRLL